MTDLQIIGTDASKFFCETCGADFKRAQELGIHKRYTHGIVSSRVKPTKKKNITGKSGSQKETCPYCGMAGQAKYLNYSHIPAKHADKVASKELVPVNHKPLGEWEAAPNFIVLRNTRTHQLGILEVLG
jgi:uncharacterized C2H2 Zn-finger protein